MTPSQVAMKVGCSVSTVKKLIREGVVKATKVKITDKSYYWDVDKSQIQKVINSQSTRGRPRG